MNLTSQLSFANNEHDQTTDILNGALPPGFKVIRARCGCGHLHSIITLPDDPTKSLTYNDLLAAVEEKNAELAQTRQEALAAHAQLAQAQGIKDHAKQLQDNNDQLRQQISSLNHQLQDLKRDNIELERTSNELEFAKNATKHHEKTIALFRERYTTLSKENERHLEAKQQAEALLDAYQQKASKLEMENTILHEQCIAHKNKVETLINAEHDRESNSRIMASGENKSLKLWKTKCHNLEQQYAATKQQLEDVLRQQNDELRNIMLEMNMNESGIFNPSVGYSMTYANATILSNSKNRNRMWRKLRDEIVKLKQRNVLLAKQMMELSKQEASASQQHALEMDTARTSIDSLQNQLQQREDKAKEFYKLEGRYTMLEKKHAALLTQHRSDKSEIEELTASLKSAKKQYSRLGHEHAQLVAKNEKRVSKSGLSRRHGAQEASQAAATIRELKTRLRTEAAAYQKLKNKLVAEHNARTRALRSAKENADREILEQKKLIESLTASERRLRVECASLVGETAASPNIKRRKYYNTSAPAGERLKKARKLRKKEILVS